MSLALGPAACSLATSWEPNGLPCHKDGSTGAYVCAVGYSCSAAAGGTTACVADHSLKPGSGCWQDRQCPEGYSCPDSICRRTCDSPAIYIPGPSCVAPSFCAPFLSQAMYTDGTAHAPQLVAACQATANCTPGQSCAQNGQSDGNICVELGTGINACLPGCQLSWTATKYGDNCGQLGGSARASCAAIGATGAQQTVCVQASIGAKAAGDSCNNAAGEPCPSGYGCFEGVCAQWCEPTTTENNNCAANMKCCHRQLNPSQLIGFCASQCP